MDYILSKSEAPIKWLKERWAGVIQVGYKRSQEILAEQLRTGNSIEDYKFLTSWHISVDNLRSQKINPPTGFTLEEYCSSLNTAYHIGQMFLFKDIKLEQEAADEQLALALAADELGSNTEHDEAIAKELDKMLNEKGEGGQPCTRNAKSNAQKNVKSQQKAKSVVQPGNIDLDVLLSEMKQSILKEVHGLLEDIFEKKFDSRLDKAMKLFRTEEVLASLKLLRDVGKICIDENIAIVLVDKTSGEEYVGSLARDSYEKDSSDKIVPKQEPSSEKRTVQRQGTQCADQGQASIASNISQHDFQVNVPSVTRVTASSTVESRLPNFPRTDAMKSLDSRSSFNIDDILSRQPTFGKGRECGGQLVPLKSSLPSATYSGSDRNASSVFSENNTSGTAITREIQRNMFQQESSQVSTSSSDLHLHQSIPPENHAQCSTVYIHQQGRQVRYSGNASSKGVSSSVISGNSHFSGQQLYAEESSSRGMLVPGHYIGQHNEGESTSIHYGDTLYSDKKYSGSLGFNIGGPNVMRGGTDKQFEGGNDISEGKTDDFVEPFQSAFDQEEFNMTVKTPPPKKRGYGKQGGTPKHWKIIGGNVKDVPHDAMSAMGPGKAMQINLIQDLLACKRTNENYQNLYPAVLELDRVPSKGPPNPHSFYKVVAKYFSHLRGLDPNEVVNVLREDIAKYAMENNRYLQVNGTFVWGGGWEGFQLIGNCTCDMLQTQKICIF